MCIVILHITLVQLLDVVNFTLDSVFGLGCTEKKMYFQMLEEIGIPEEKNRLELELLSEPVRP